MPEYNNIVKAVTEYGRNDIPYFWPSRINLGLVGWLVILNIDSILPAALPKVNPAGPKTWGFFVYVFTYDLFILGSFVFPVI